MGFGIRDSGFEKAKAPLRRVLPRPALPNPQFPIPNPGFKPNPISRIPNPGAPRGRS